MVDNGDGSPESRKADGPRVQLSATLPDGTVKTIDLPAPDSMTMGSYVLFEDRELSTEKQVLGLMLQMYNYPETTWEHYSSSGMKGDPALKEAIERRDVILVKSDNYYYKHPKTRRFYIFIKPLDGELRDWEQKVVDQGPAYTRCLLKLSERKRREFEILQRIEMEETLRSRQVAEKYSSDVFLSYSDRDHAIAESTRQALVGAGARIFMAPKSLEPGDDFAEEIRQSIVGAAEVWVIFSPNSISSEWVITELGAAWVLQKNIVPILHRCDVPHIPGRLRSLQCIDAAELDGYVRRRFGSEA